MNLKTMLVVSDPAVAAYAAANGVDRLFVDLEWMGKAERQPGDTQKSKSGPEDISRVREAAPDANLMVRVNPFHEGTRAEVEDAVARGADVLMLPMFRDAGTVGRFMDLVPWKAATMPLVETKAALDAVPEIAALGPDELYIGLNDLHLDMGMRFMFQPLAEGLLDAPCRMLCDARISFGIGGIARLGQGVIPAEMVLNEHARLGSEWVILSRGFYERAETVDALEAVEFGRELASLKDYARKPQPADELAETHREFTRLVAEIAA